MEQFSPIAKLWKLFFLPFFQHKRHRWSLLVVVSQFCLEILMKHKSKWLLPFYIRFQSLLAIFCTWIAPYSKHLWLPIKVNKILINYNQAAAACPRSASAPRCRPTPRPSRSSSTSSTAATRSAEDHLSEKWGWKPWLFFRLTKIANNDQSIFSN